MASQRGGTALSRTTIAETALRLVDRDGPDALSFRALGADLGVSHMAVHRAVGSLDGLLDTCVDHLAAQLPTLPGATAWRSALEQRFTALYRTLSAHPGIVALRRARPWLSPEILSRLVEPALTDLHHAGLPRAEAAGAYRRLYLYTLGCAAFVDHLNPATAETRTRQALAALDPAAFPALAASLHEVATAATDDSVFHEGLQHLLDGIAPRP